MWPRVGMLVRLEINWGWFASSSASARLRGTGFSVIKIFRKEVDTAPSAQTLTSPPAGPRLSLLQGAFPGTSTQRA